MAQIFSAPGLAKHIGSGFMQTFPSTKLDWILYTGAAALVAGTLQISTLMDLSLAQMPTVTEAKSKWDLCRTQAPYLALPKPATVASSPELLLSKTCKDFPTEVEQAASAEPLREHARQLTLIFGVTFSVLLGFIYMSAATLLTAEAHAVVALQVADPADIKARLLALGIESDQVGKLGRLLTSFSPLVAGVVSTLLSKS